MRNLLQFIYRYHFFLLFVLLFTLAMVINASRQHYKQALIWHSANIFSAHIYQFRQNVVSYFNLREVNQTLIDENVILFNQLEENFMFADETTFIVEDSLQQRKYTYMHADIINNSINLRNNYLTLNKGKKHGVRPDMGVVTPNGVVGIVKAVSKNFSLVNSLLHSETIISVKIEKNGHIGSLLWNGENYRIADMTYIPPHVELEAKDKVVTSGYSVIFPGNIPVGHMIDWEIRRGETFYTAKVELYLDFNKLNHVYIVKNLLQDEQEELEAMGAER